MEAKFCRNKDGNVAVGVGRWEGRTVKNPNPKRPDDLCRACYIETHGSEFIKVEVLGAGMEFAIACARTGNDITTGGVAELDPTATNIAALVAAGLVRVLPAEEPAEAAEPAQEPAAKGKAKA